MYAKLAWNIHRKARVRTLAAELWGKEHEQSGAKGES